MSDPEEQGLLDQLVELAARGLDALGLNGARLRWKWNRRSELIAERKAQAETYVRSARGKHKMCRSCRALVPKSARQCPECGTDLGDVSTPGVGRVLSQLLPGAGAVTALLMLVNGFFFALMLIAQIKSGEGAGLFASFDFMTSARFGSSLGRIPFTEGAWWRLITPIFLHGGLIHFAFNSYALLNLGPIVENAYDRERFWVVYLLCGIGGNTLSSLFGSNVVGASGAIFGLIGLLIVFGARARSVAGRNLKSFLTRWALFMFIFSLLPGISFAAHAGGFVMGLLLGALVPSGQLRSMRARRLWALTAGAAVLLVLLAFWQVAREGWWT